MNIFQDLKSKLEKGFEQAGQQSQRVLEISRLNMKIKSKKDELAELVDQLGWAVFESWEPKEKFTLTVEVERALQNAYDVEQQLGELEDELDRLKNSNITSRTTAETVRLPAVNLDEQTKKASEARAIAKVVYLCPFCAHEVSVDTIRCAHCNETY